ncbi:unnamed protein product [Heligmosomoides polygyrus]|uniref:CUB domain-containing protein n=1 Tax=Heligmosomoides polygyrus TaxID=6339 RepID=A0A183FYK1_HELPZ|nr:unnamed protein product [Heligmosomoides polygyrus]
MIVIQAELHTEWIPALHTNASKCYRDSLAVSVTSFIFITTYRSVLGRRRMPIPRELCEEAVRTGYIHGHALTVAAPGIRSTNEIEDETITTAFWGTNIYPQSVFTLEEGEITSFDERSTITSLSNTENCSLADGHCIMRQYVIVWKPISPVPHCRYILAGSQMTLVFEFDARLDFANIGTSK